MPQPPEQSQLDEIYAGLYGLIEERKILAEQQCRNLLVVIGETHTDKKCLLSEMMILDMAKKLGIGNLITELNKDNLYAIQRGGILTDEVNFVPLVYYATNKKMNVAAGASYETSQDYQFYEKRESNMLTAADGIGDHALMILGDQHLMGVINHDLAKKYEILALNSTTSTKEHLQRALANRYIDNERLRYAFDPNAVIQLRIDGDGGRLWVEQIKNMVTTAQSKTITNAAASSQSLLERSRQAGKEYLEIIDTATKDRSSEETVVSANTPEVAGLHDIGQVLHNARVRLAHELHNKTDGIKNFIGGLKHKAEKKQNSDPGDQQIKK